MKIRISLVHYLNAAPLGWSFLYGPHRDRFEVIPASPARCAEQLALGEVEIGVIPSIEYQRIPNLAIIPGIAIAAIGAVRSVIMVSRRGQPIRSVALDASSKTSVELLKLLLEARLGLKPAYVEHTPDLPAMLRLCDAALLIGDAALRVSRGEYEVLDLAQAWMDWQRRPFVFAFWACRTDVPLPEDLGQTFLEARDWGMRERAEIAKDYARRLALPEPFLLDYLLQNVNYDLGSEHIEGLQMFYNLAYGRGLISENRPLRFLPAYQVNSR